MTSRRRGSFGRLALAFCTWFVAGLAAAQALDLTRAPSQDFAGRLALIEDPDGSMDLAAIRQADEDGHFARFADSIFSFGFTRGAVWLRFSVANPAGAPPERWLVLDNSLLGSAVLHVVEHGVKTSTMASGLVVPVTQRPLASGRILFPLDVLQGQQVTGYLRLSGAMPLASHIELWQPASFADAEWRRLIVKALIVSGALTAVILFSFYFWKNNRQWAILAIALGDALFALATFMVDGVTTDLMPANEQLWQGRATGILVLLALYLNIEFSRVYLELPRIAPRLALFMRALAVAAVGGAALQCLLLDVKLLTFQMPLAITFLATATVALAAWQGSQKARLYLLNWAGLLAVVLLILGGALAKLSFAVHVSNLPMPSFVLASLVLAYAMYREVRLAGAEAERAHNRLRDLQRTEQERLAVAVEQRTRELRQAKIEAEEAGLARLTFLSTVSHELRTPLHTILGYAQLLRRHGGRREADTKLASIESSGLQLLHLIDGILEFVRGASRTIVLRPGSVAIADLVRQLGDTGRVLAAAGRNDFQVELVGSVPAVVEVDEHRLLQVVHNLISNACKYTSNGRIVLHIEPGAQRTDDEAALGLHRLCFAVEDTGIGIASSQLQRIFEPFSRVAGSEYRPGIGLGLAIARQIVRAMGGEMGVESETGRGSRFHFEISLPVVFRETDDAIGDSPRIVGHVGPRRSLLVADDIAENREFLRDLCSEWGFDVMVAEGGAEALALCRAQSLPDCILVDQFMPGMDGWGFLRELRSVDNLHDVPVILVSAAEPQRPADAPSGVDFDRVLLKPIRHQDLAVALQQLLNVEWIVDQAEEEPVAQGGCTGVPLPAELATVREMLALGRVVAIRRWAERLAEAHPDLAVFGRELAARAEAVDLAGIEQMIEVAARRVSGSTL